MSTWLDCSTLHTRSYWLQFSFLTMWPWFWHRQTLTRYKTHNNQKFYADTQLMFWYSNNWLFNLATICIVFYILIPQSSGKCQGDPDSNKAESNLIYWSNRYNNVNIYASGGAARSLYICMAWWLASPGCIAWCAQSQLSLIKYGLKQK